MWHSQLATLRCKCVVRRNTLTRKEWLEFVTTERQSIGSIRLSLVMYINTSNGEDSYHESTYVAWGIIKWSEWCLWIAYIISWTSKRFLKG